MPATPVDLATAFSSAFKEITMLVRELVAGAEVRRMRKCIRQGDLIIERIVELRIKDKKLSSYRKKWQTLNN